MNKRKVVISSLREGRIKLKQQQLPLAMKAQLMVYCFLTIAAFGTRGVDGKSILPCYFVFGDSQADNGNNNILNIGMARADYKPYGIDFSKQQTPTGRFTNGRNIPDFIAKFLGFVNYIPPFENTKDSDILKGVNYASGGSGILPETGRLLGQISSIGKQLENHNRTISKIQALLGSKSRSTRYLKRCLYTIQIGSNDYLNNYFLPLNYKTSFQFTPEQFATTLNKELSRQLKSLYEQGARKVAVFGVGSIGCTPYARANFEHKGAPCVDKINSAVQLFNIGLKSLVEDLNTQFPDAKFIFVDVFQISTIQPSNFGKMVLEEPCCEVLPGQLQCSPFGKVCGDRSQYLFWDGVHPTEIGFTTVASRAFNSQQPGDTHPFDIKHLIGTF